MHGKSLVTDRRFAFVGSANFTDKSERNGELLWQLRGMPVLDTLDFLQEECSKGTLLYSPRPKLMLGSVADKGNQNMSENMRLWSM